MIRQSPYETVRPITESAATTVVKAVSPARSAESRGKMAVGIAKAKAVVKWAECAMAAANPPTSAIAITCREMDAGAPTGMSKIGALAKMTPRTLRQEVKEARQ